jgi:hypothetical protein
MIPLLETLVKILSRLTDKKKFAIDYAQNIDYSLLVMRNEDTLALVNVKNVISSRVVAVQSRHRSVWIHWKQLCIVNTFS